MPLSHLPGVAETRFPSGLIHCNRVSGDRSINKRKLRRSRRPCDNERARAQRTPVCSFLARWQGNASWDSDVNPRYPVGPRKRVSRIRIARLHDGVTEWQPNMAAVQRHATVLHRRGYGHWEIGHDAPFFSLGDLTACSSFRGRWNY